MSLGDILASSVAGVDQEWFAKVRHMHRMIEKMQKGGMYIKYQFDTDMQYALFLKVVPNAEEIVMLTIDYLDIDAAVRLVTKWYRGVPPVETLDDLDPYFSGFLDERDINF